MYIYFSCVEKAQNVQYLCNPWKYQGWSDWVESGKHGYQVILIHELTNYYETHTYIYIYIYIYIISICLHINIFT